MTPGATRPWNVMEVSAAIAPKVSKSGAKTLGKLVPLKSEKESFNPPDAKSN
jgi:hypothetical protein